MDHTRNHTILKPRNLAVSGIGSKSVVDTPDIMAIMILRKTPQIMKHVIVVMARVCVTMKLAGMRDWPIPNIPAMGADTTKIYQQVRA